MLDLLVSYARLVQEFVERGRDDYEGYLIEGYLNGDYRDDDPDNE
jgi:hypothetical protein